MASSKRKNRSQAYSAPSPASSTSEEDSLYTAASPKRSVRKETEQRRRVMMNQYFDELVMMLSVVSDRIVPRKLDKASTLQEAVRIIRQYYHLDMAGGRSTPDVSESSYRPEFFNRGEVMQFLLNAVSSFLMVICDKGRILFCTDLVSSLTGHAPTKLIGQNIFDFVHDQDKPKLASVFNLSNEQSGISLPGSPITSYPVQQFTCHFKLQSTESSMLDTDKEFSCLAYLRKWKDVAEEDSSPPPSPGPGPTESSIESQSYMLLLLKTSSSLSNIDQPIATNDVNFSFNVRVSKEGKVLEIDKHASLVLGYTSWELVGSSFFDYVHPYHVQRVGEAMSSFLDKGLGVSQPYRIRSKSTRYLWIVSKGYLSYNPWNHKPDHVLLQNKLLGSDEVLPEFRFASNNHVKPDMQGRENYIPPPVTSQCPIDTQVRQNQSMGWGPSSQRVQFTYGAPYQPSGVSPSFGQSSQSGQLVNHHGSRFIGQSNQQFSQQGVQPSRQLTSQLGISSYDSTSSSAGMRAGATRTPEGSLDEVQRQLEQKNKELFDLQCRILAQQQLFEQERNQFYQMTNQVMHYIGTQGQQMTDVLPPGMAMAVSIAGSAASSNTSPTELKQGLVSTSPSNALPTDLASHKLQSPHATQLNPQSSLTQPSPKRSKPSSPPPCATVQVLQDQRTLEEMLMETYPLSSVPSQTVTNAPSCSQSSPSSSTSSSLNQHDLACLPPYSHSSTSYNQHVLRSSSQSSDKLTTPTSPLFSADPQRNAWLP